MQLPRRRWKRRLRRVRHRGSRWAIYPRREAAHSSVTDVVLGRVAGAAQEPRSGKQELHVLTSLCLEHLSLSHARSFFSLPPAVRICLSVLPLSRSRLATVIGVNHSDMMFTTVYDFKGTGAPGHGKYFLRPSVRYSSDVCARGERLAIYRPCERLQLRWLTQCLKPSNFMTSPVSLRLQRRLISAYFQVGRKLRARQMACIVRLPSHHSALSVPSRLAAFFR